MTIRSEFEYGILRLTIDRPAQRNAFNADMFDQLAGELDAARQNDKVRVVLLKGSTGLFSAGADVRESLNAPETIDAAAGRLFETLRSFPKPIVAEVAGPAVGDAFTILLYCDLVYASDKALFSVPSVALGRTPRFGTAALVFGSAGRGKALAVRTHFRGRCARHAPHFSGRPRGRPREGGRRQGCPSRRPAAAGRRRHEESSARRPKRVAYRPD